MKFNSMHYPIRDHAFVPCDRDFALIKRVLNKTKRFYDLDQFIEIISQLSKIPGKFSVVKVTSDLVHNFKNYLLYCYSIYVITII